jgi:hypothetical protein
MFELMIILEVKEENLDGVGLTPPVTAICDALSLVT